MRKQAVKAAALKAAVEAKETVEMIAVAAGATAGLVMSAVKRIASKAKEGYCKVTK